MTGTAKKSMTIRADAIDLPFADGIFQLAITSPPYFGKVRYGDSDDEHGTGSLFTYVSEIVTMAAEVYRVTDDRAVFFLNIGDTMANSGGAGGDHNKGGRKDWKPKYKQGETGIKGAQHCLVPQRVALDLQTFTEWKVKRWITWDKTPNVRPESIDHVRRPLDCSETILMLVKGKGYRYRPHVHAKKGRDGIELGDVWHFPPERAKTGHQAPFPEELPRRCIMLCSSPGDLVLDPYVGSGTTVRVANEMERVGIGADLYAKDPSTP